MNLRTLKKHCKRAVPFLIAKYGYKAEYFTPADGSETIYAPHGMEKRFARHGFINPGLLKGTPVYWHRCNYEYDEWECDLPSEILKHIKIWENLEGHQVATLLLDPVETAHA